MSKKKVDMKKRDTMFMVVIGVVIVIAIIACIVFAFNGKGKEEKNEVDNSNTNTQEGNETQEEKLDGQIDYSKKENVIINNNVKENNSEALLKEKKFEGMKVKETKLTASEGTTKFITKIENTSSVDFVAQKVVILFKNKDGSEFDRLDTYLGDIKVGGTAEIDATTTSDLSNAYDFEIIKGE